jgi:ubiquinone/menaquinone biosynthesis C-methylase UbiE
MANDSAAIWQHDKAYEELLRNRAQGHAPEMQSAVATCHHLARFYKPGLSVFDVGCGSGHYLRSLRERLDPAVAYTGVDATKPYIALARHSFPGVPFFLGDILSLPLADQSFDIVMCINVINHLPPPPLHALEELVRVARQHLLIRAAVGKRNYIIKELAPVEGGNYAKRHSNPEVVPSDTDAGLFHYRNLYTVTYLVESLKALAPTLDIEIVRDTDFTSFDNRSQSAPTGTHVVGKRQVAGNLLLDYRFIVVHKR